MSRAFLIAILAGAGAAGTSAGADKAPPVATEIRKQYWQVLHGIRKATVDQQGRAWLSTSKKCSVADSYRSDFKLLPHDQTLLLADRKGRLWLNQRYSGTKPTRMYDGKQWHTMPFHAIRAMEDSAGRVFLAGTTHLHMLGLDGKWSRHKHSDKPAWWQWGMRTDPDGGMWIWPRPVGRKKPSQGVWCRRKGAWHHLTAKGGFPFDRADMIVPLGGQRCLVIAGYGSALPNFAVWSWPPGAGKHHDFLPGISARQLRVFGIDLEGNCILTATGLRRKGQPLGPDKTAILCFAPNGKGSVLTARSNEFRALGIHSGRQLLFSVRDRRRWDGKNLHFPPVGRSVFGVDRLGRIYFRGDGLSREVQVLWPARQQPGDLLVATPAKFPKGYNKIPYSRRGPVVRNAAGGIWLSTGRTLLQWRDGAWQPTPVETKPHPPWDAEPMPPWSQWWQRGSRPRVFVGRDGAMLVVILRDVYQDISVNTDERLAWRRIRELGAEALQGGKPPYWPEAWLYHKGQWSGPEKLHDMLRRNAGVLVKNFTSQTTQLSWFDLQSDGKCLWVSYEGTVHAYSADGKVVNWPLPLPAPAKDRRRWPLPQTNLVCMGGGKTWCVHGTDKLVDVSALSLAKGNIWSKPMPAAGWATGAYAERLYVSRDGRAWRWAPSRGLLHQWKAGRWHKREDLGPLVLEDDDGALWFRRLVRKASGRGYDILYKGKRHRIDWPTYLPMNPQRPLIRIARGRYVVAHGHHLVQFARPAGAGPGQWQIARVHRFQGAHVYYGAFLDSKGSLVTATGWFGKFPIASIRPAGK